MHVSTREHSLNHFTSGVKYLSVFLWVKSVFVENSFQSLKFQISPPFWSKIKTPFTEVFFTNFSTHKLNTISGSSVIWTTTTQFVKKVWLNGWGFANELSGSEFESRCCQLHFRYGACFEQGVPWHSDKL